MARTLTCQLCGTTFECRGLDPFKKCWCRETKLSKEKLEKISKAANDCVCESCLKK